MVIKIVKPPLYVYHFFNYCKMQVNVFQVYAWPFDSIKQKDRVLCVKNDLNPFTQLFFTYRLIIRNTSL